MPEPLSYLQALASAAIVSALCVLAMAWLKRPVSTTRLNLACVLAMAVGLAAGASGLSPRWTYPPANALDRFLMLVLPLTLGIELIAGFPRVPGWIAWTLRLSLAATIPRILLHGSIYLSGTSGDWAMGQPTAGLAVCGALLAGVWTLLSCLSQRSDGASIPLALALAIQCAGLSIMMAGYIKGGAVAFPLTGTLIATALGAKLITQRPGTSPIIGIGVVSLFGLLFIGRFFGRLSTPSVLTMILAPLLCWATELPFLRNRNPRLKGSLRLAFIAIPLAIVLALAKHEFNRDMLPLLGHISTRDNPSLSTLNFLPSTLYYGPAAIGWLVVERTREPPASVSRFRLPSETNVVDPCTSNTGEL